MLTLGSLKLRRWRQTVQDTQVVDNRSISGRSITLDDAATRLGVSKMFVSFLEKGDRKPGLALAARMEALGIAPAADWTRPVRCAECRNRHEGSATRRCVDAACPFGDQADDAGDQEAAA